MKMLCVDDNSHMDKARYCTWYGLNPDYVEYAASLDEALELIRTRLIEFDLVILDIDIEFKDKGCISYLEEIVCPAKLKGITSSYGGFYLYLMLLHMGFPHQRVAFLSGFLQEEQGGIEEVMATLDQIALAAQNQQFSQEKLEQWAGMLAEVKLKTSKTVREQLKGLERKLGQGNREEFVAQVAKLRQALGNLQDSAQMGAAEVAASRMDSIGSSQLGINSDEKNEKTLSIANSFAAFAQAGINFPQERRFSKSRNVINPDDPQGKVTQLLQWLDKMDPNRYYLLRGGIVAACKELGHMLTQRMAELEKLEQQAYEKSLQGELAKHTSTWLDKGDFYKIKSIAEELHREKERFIASQLVFHSYIDFKYNGPNVLGLKLPNAMDQRGQKQELEVMVSGNNRRDIYTLGYFRDMLQLVQELLPVREPQNQETKNQLFRQIIKVITHPWEAGVAKYPTQTKEQPDREELFLNTCSCVLKSVRNWTAHSKLTQFSEGDVAFLFLLAMRSYFRGELNKVNQYEHTLLRVLRETEEQEPKEEARREAVEQSWGQINALLTSSINNLTRDWGKKLATINVYRLFHDQGERESCEMAYLYKMFWHVMHYPGLELMATSPYIFYNKRHSGLYREGKELAKNGKVDLVTQVYLGTFYRALGQEFAALPQRPGKEKSGPTSR